MCGGRSEGATSCRSMEKVRLLVKLSGEVPLRFMQRTGLPVGTAMSSIASNFKTLVVRERYVFCSLSVTEMAYLYILVQQGSLPGLKLK